jgi:hypothetical protein
MKGSVAFGGFDLLIGYDASALNFIHALPGDAIAAPPTGCGWEYFTYRYGWNGNCGGPCPSGFLRIVSIADQNNGPNHPACYFIPNGGELAKIKFYLTNDRTYDCQYVPIRFAWIDCGDNTFSNVMGDTLLIAERVFDYLWSGDFGDIGPDNYEITGTPWIFGGWQGSPLMQNQCDTLCERCKTYPGCDVDGDGIIDFQYGECKNEPIIDIWFWNGGVDIACADSIDRRGDLNLNGIENEIADAVLYTNFFLYGIGVFDIAPDGQIAASDVNNDGIVLSVGDLVYLIRIITGDALPYPKLAPFADKVQVNVVDGAVATDASSDLGAVYAVFAVDGVVDVVNHTDMELISNVENGELRVLVYSGTKDLTNRLPAGVNELFTVAGDAELVKVEVADYNGNLLTANVNKTALPTDFALLQNVPNPFNPTTKITLELPTVTDWNLDIYNVTGQLVKTFSGTDQGVVTVEWNASGVASGIYFYKATAGAFTDIKKMVLMK